MRGQQQQEGKRQETIWWERYQNGRAYQSSMKMTTLIPRYVDFYEGRQYPPMTTKTKDVPRPVLNIVQMICRNKKANILSATTRCVYRSPNEAREMPTDMNGMPTDMSASEGERANMADLNDFSEYISREMSEGDINAEAVLSGIVKGTGIWHYYWDNEARGLDGTCEGGMRCECVNPLNCFVEDPTEHDEQKQAWILFVSRVPVNTVRARADRDVDKDLIVADDKEPSGKSANREEQRGTELCTLLTGYFRRDGEVMVETAVKGCIVNRAHPITPDVDDMRSRMRGELEQDPEGSDVGNAAMPDKGVSGERIPSDVRATQRAKSYLYPVTIWSYEVREGSIYGRGEVEGLLPNQRAINETMSSMAFSIKTMCWPKIITTPDALGGQKITNEPGQHLIDNAKIGNGIRYLDGKGPDSAAKAFVEMIVTLTRSVSGATEVMTGESSYANMSGAAIAQLQSQAQIPLEDIRSGYWRALERCGRIKAQFLRTYYTNRVYTKPVRDERAVDETGMPIEEYQKAVFNSKPFASIPLECVCETTTGTRSSTAGDIQILETAYGKGEIDFETLIMMYPESAIGNKTEILETIRQRKNGELAQANATIEQLNLQLSEMQNQLAAMAAQREADAKAIESAEALIAANERLRKEILVLQTEAAYKIGQANDTINLMNGEYSKVKDDATYLSACIAKRMGLPEGADIPPDVLDAFIAQMEAASVGEDQAAQVPAAVPTA